MLEADAASRELSSGHFNARNVPHEFLSYSNEVMTFLHRKLIDNEALPRVIILKLQAAPQNGFYVLQEVKDNDHFKHIPVVIMGENTPPDMVKRCYEYGANTVVNKQVEGEQTESRINAFLDYWFGVAETAGKQLAY